MSSSATRDAVLLIVCAIVLFQIRACSGRDVESVEVVVEDVSVVSAESIDPPVILLREGTVIPIERMESVPDGWIDWGCLGSWCREVFLAEALDGRAWDAVHMDRFYSSTLDVLAAESDIQASDDAWADFAAALDEHPGEWVIWFMDVGNRGTPVATDRDKSMARDVVMRIADLAPGAKILLLPKYDVGSMHCGFSSDVTRGLAGWLANELYPMVSVGPVLGPVQGCSPRPAEAARMAAQLEEFLG